MPKSMPCFEILGNFFFRWHLETWENQIGSIFKLKKKKVSNFKNKLPPYHLHHHHPAKFHPAPPPPEKKIGTMFHLMLKVIVLY
jgi:hypothetical protein